MYFYCKVFYPETKEFHLVQLRSHFRECDYQDFKDRIRTTFGIKDDQEFHFTVRDNSGDEITIRNYWGMHYLIYVYKTVPTEIRTTIVLENQPIAMQENAESPRPLESRNPSVSANQTESIASSSVADKLRERDDASIFSESLQSIMKHLEQGISSLQASVEKSTTSTVDAVVKTAAETAANVYRSILPPPTLSEKPQFDVICDGCYTPIRGQRWRCETCDDFDLCSTCKSRVNHNGEHNFRFIKNKSTPFTPLYQQEEEERETQAESSRSDSSSSSQIVFICDYCDSDIVGIRHTCGACPDFDLCHSCFAIVKENHPEHIFVTRLVGTQANKSKNCRKNKKSRSINSSIVSPRQSHDQITTVIHQGVECDNCEVEITGTRYKCGHCANYDLCETCEEYSMNIHDNTHAFIKIRYPIQSLSKKPILPKFSPLTKVIIAEQNTKEMEMVNAASASTNTFNSDRNIASSASSSPLSVMIPPFVVDTQEQKDEKEEEFLSAGFLSDLNIPDGTLVVPNKSFIKMWKIVNNGNVDWPVGTHLLFNGGSILRPYPVTKPNTFVVPVTAPNEEACISAELQAPDCPGEYSSYYCLCTADGVRFGDSLWCTIKVDFDEEPDNNVNTMTSSEYEKKMRNAEDIMMNSSNSMIYPTISTAASSIHAEIEDSHSPTHTNNDYDFTDHDDYSEFTNDHVSTVTSEITRSYSDSHISSPTSSELDIGERNRDMMFFTTEEEEEDDEEEVRTEEHHNYQVISPSASTILLVDTTTTQEPTIVEESTVIEKSTTVEESIAKEEKEEEDDEDFVLEDEDFVFVDEDEKATKEEPTFAEESPLHSSVETITKTNAQNTHHEDFIYQSQLLQLHEMGFTSYDDLAMSLLNLHKGSVDDVISKLLMYP